MDEHSVTNQPILESNYLFNKKLDKKSAAAVKISPGILSSSQPPIPQGQNQETHTNGTITQQSRYMNVIGNIS
jgi:hypothetical protein